VKPPGAPATVAGTYKAMQQPWRWLVDEGKATCNPCDRMKPPHVPGPSPSQCPSDERLLALLATCKAAEFIESAVAPP
jgi:site-specific recombinase XerC